VQEGSLTMINQQLIAIDHFVKKLRSAYHDSYGSMETQISDVIAWSAKLALENISNSDALYHNLDHTIMVTSAGQSIIKGKHLCEGGVSPADWLHFTLALLFHDIGYVRGVCRNDKEGIYDIGDNREIELSSGTDAALTPYHVDRSIIFVRERFGGKLLIDVDVDTIAYYIDMTRFPVPDHQKNMDTKGYPSLVRAADFIGQLGDPNYLRKIPALFYEFEEIGTNNTMGYKNPRDLRDNYAKFYWNVVIPYIQDAVKYLRLTQEGKRWIASLQSHVFDIEHREKAQE
jgi:hypothetical protein